MKTDERISEATTAELRKLVREHDRLIERLCVGTDKPGQDQEWCRRLEAIEDSVLDLIREDAR